MKKTLISSILLGAIVTVSSFSWAENSQQNTKTFQIGSTTEFFKTPAKYKGQDVILYSVVLGDNKSIALVYNPNEEDYDEEGGGDSPSITYLKYFDSDGKSYPIISTEICEDSPSNYACKVIGFYPSTLPSFGTLVKSLQHDNSKIKTTWEFTYLKNNNIEYTSAYPVPKLGALMDFYDEEYKIFLNEGWRRIQWDIE